MSIFAPINKIKSSIPNGKTKKAALVKKFKKLMKVDDWGIFISSLCALHCLLTPFLIFSFPILSTMFHHPLFHISIALLVVPLGVYAFYQGFKHHKKISILIWGNLGLAIISFAALAPHSWVHFFGHDLITIVGSIFLIIAHVLNRRACLCRLH